MSMRIQELHFEGPYISAKSLEETSGIYAIFCQKPDGEYQLLRFSNASNVRACVEKLTDSGLCMNKHCRGSLVFAALYTPIAKAAKNLDTICSASRKCFSSIGQN